MPKSFKIILGLSVIGIVIISVLFVSFSYELESAKRDEIINNLGFVCFRQCKLINEYRNIRKNLECFSLCYKSFYFPSEKNVTNFVNHMVKKVVDKDKKICLNILEGLKEIYDIELKKYSICRIWKEL